MIGAILGEFWPIIAAVVATLMAFVFGKSNGKKSARLEMERADSENASDIRERVDDAILTHDSDDRPVDDRLRDKGRLRD